MITKQIFLASSSELKEDRTEFEIFISRKNKDLIQKDVFLEIILWEDFLDAMSQTRLQDEYNNAIRGCDIFLMLFFTKVGQYTEEEFETAFGQFKDTNKPVIYTYFKDAEISTGSAKREDLQGLWAFQDKLNKLGHFYTVYKNVDDLKFKFDQQLNKLVLSAPRTPIEQAIEGRGPRTRRVPHGDLIQITSPVDGGMLEDPQPLWDGFSYVVRGTLERLPIDHAIWLLNGSRDGRQWPQGWFTVRHDYPRSGAWEGRIYLPRSVSDIIINAVVAPPTSRRFFEYYQQYGAGNALTDIPIECTNKTQIRALTPASHQTKP